MFCTKCGKMIPDDSKFCSACGNAVSGPYASTSTSQPQSGSVYLRPSPPMTPPQPTAGYRTYVRPMTPPPAVPQYQPPVRPVTPPPAAPQYQPPVRPVTPPPAAPQYQPPVRPVTPPPAAPQYQPPMRPVTPPPAAPQHQPPVQPVPVATEAIVAEPVVNRMPESAAVHIDNVSENTENIMVDKSKLTPFKAKPEPATEAPKPNAELEVNKTEDIINQEATVTEMYIPADAAPVEEKTVAVDNVENVSSTINEDKKPVFYTEPNVVSCEEPKKPVVKTILKITCAVFAVIFAIAALILGSVRMAFTEENVSSVIDDANIGNIIEENGGNLGAFCIDRISDEDMKKIFEQKPFKDYFKKAANEYLTYILGGEKGESLSGKTFSELIKNNPDVVKKASGYEFRSFEYEMVESGLNRAEEFSEIYDCDETQALRFVFSIYTLIGLIVLALLCLAGVVIFSNDKSKAIRLVGIIVAGIAILVFALIFVVKLCIAVGVYGGLAVALDGALNTVILPACITCGSTLLVGIILFVISLIGRKKI